MMNILQALQQARQRLANTSPSAVLDAEVLLSFVLKCNSAHLVAWPDKELTVEQTTHFLHLLQQRQQGMPVAYITGSREFWSLDFSVDNSTLIPRPETETLIDFILSTFTNSKKLKLLDMGTGSGAIAITIAREKPEWEIFASDISKQALQLAAQNSKKHQTSVQLIHSDWFDNIPGKDFDIIVSNPPYIEADDPHLQQGDVRFEPATALVAGKTGMDDIKKLCLHAKRFLAEDGYLVIEHGYNQKQQVFNCFANNGFKQIEQKKDLSGHTRITAGKII